MQTINFSNSKILHGKTAVITGASRGIGKAIALAMAKNGADIAVIFSSNETAAMGLINNVKDFDVNAKAYQCDVADFEQANSVCETIADDFGKVDILVNNAGVTKDGFLIAMDETDFDAVINVNLKGAFNFTKSLSRHLTKSPGGRVINISSVSGLAGNAGQSNYSASKAGLIGFTKSIAKEMAKRKVTCNVIAPGFIETDMTADLSESIIGDIPLNRIGKPEEVASLAVFLASEYAAYITGEVIKVDGGIYI